METGQDQQNQAQQMQVSRPAMTQEQIMLEVLENTRKTKNYMKWQLYITLVLVVLPILAMVFIIPMVLRSVANIYGSILQ